MDKLEALHKELDAARAEHDAASAQASAQLDNIMELEHKIVQEEQFQATLSNMREGATQLRALYTAFVEAGFSDAQSFALINTLLQNAMAPSTPAPITHGAVIKALLK